MEKWEIFLDRYEWAQIFLGFLLLSPISLTFHFSLAKSQTKNKDIRCKILVFSSRWINTIFEGVTDTVRVSAANYRVDFFPLWFRFKRRWLCCEVKGWSYQFDKYFQTSPSAKHHSTERKGVFQSNTSTEEFYSTVM